MTQKCVWEGINWQIGMTTKLWRKVGLKRLAALNLAARLVHMLTLQQPQTHTVGTPALLRQQKQVLLSTHHPW